MVLSLELDAIKLLTVTRIVDVRKFSSLQNATIEVATISLIIPKHCTFRGEILTYQLVFIALS